MLPDHKQKLLTVENTTPVFQRLLNYIESIQVVFAGSGPDSVQTKHASADAPFSHAEGSSTIADGVSSHAEGCGTKANGNYSHAEGYYTKASKAAQSVSGTYNIEDTAATTTHPSSQSKYGKYAEIVGNGTADNARSNARTLDWQGNEWLAGDLTFTVNGVEHTLSDLLNLATDAAGANVFIDSNNSGNQQRTKITMMNRHHVIKAPECPFTPPANMIFDHWCRVADGSSDAIAAGDMFSVSDDPMPSSIVLYAQYVPDEVILEYTLPSGATTTYHDLNRGSGSSGYWYELDGNFDHLAQAIYDYWNDNNDLTAVVFETTHVNTYESLNFTSTSVQPMNNTVFSVYVNGMADSTSSRYMNWAVLKDSSTSNPVTKILLPAGADPMSPATAPSYSAGDCTITIKVPQELLPYYRAVVSNATA